MFCGKCGKEIPEGVSFCGACGTPCAEVHEDVAVAQSVEPVCESTPLSIGLNVVGYLLYAVAVIDFAGMFFGYDITGVSWSPIAFGAVGGLCQGAAENFTKKSSVTKTK